MKIPVALCSSERYLDYVTTAIWSALLSGSQRDEYKLFVLHIGIGKLRQEQFLRDMGQWPNLSITFLDVSQKVAEYAPSANGVKETWFSLLLPECLPDYDKILALDCDLIVKRDLRKLFETDVQKFFLAAALDPDFIGQYHGGNSKYRKYYREIVPVKDPYQYFQGGVYVLNLAKLRKAFCPGELFTQAANNRYWYDEQDVLNMHCAGAVNYLDLRWNLLYDSFGYRKNLIIGLAPPTIRKLYAEARKDPWIIHYAGGERPWKNAGCDYAEEFWKIADQTPIAARLRKELSTAKPEGNFFLRRIFRLLRFAYRKLYVMKQGRMTDV